MKVRKAASAIEKGAVRALPGSRTSLKQAKAGVVITARQGDLLRSTQAGNEVRLKKSKAILVRAFGALALFSAVLEGCNYFPESTFELAASSRLPKWVTPPTGLARADVHLTMSYYVVPVPRASFTADAKEHTFLKLNGKTICELFSLVNSNGGPTQYPSYQAVSVNGITEVMEHKKMEPIFYVTDDPAVWRRYKELGCGK